MAYLSTHINVTRMHTEISHCCPSLCEGVNYTNRRTDRRNTDVPDINALARRFKTKLLTQDHTTSCKTRERGVSDGKRVRKIISTQSSLNVRRRAPADLSWARMFTNQRKTTCEIVSSSVRESVLCRPTWRWKLYLSQTDVVIALLW